MAIDPKRRALLAPPITPKSLCPVCGFSLEGLPWALAQGVHSWCQGTAGRSGATLEVTPRCIKCGGITTFGYQTCALCGIRKQLDPQA